MDRDGTCPSLWQENIKNYDSGVHFIPNREYDVAVVGGGITGLTTALLLQKVLQKAGRSCILIEAKNIGFGTTGGTTAHINTYFERPYYEVRQHFDEKKAKLLARAGREAVDTIEGIVREHGIDCDFQRVPSYMIAEDTQQEKELDKTLKSILEVGQVADWTEEVPTPRAFTKAMRVPDQAQFHPVKYLHGMAKAFQDAGGIIVQNCRSLDAKEGETIDLETTRGPIRTRSLVYATHTPPGVNVLHFRVAPYRSYALAVKLKHGECPDALIYDLEDPYHYYRSQVGSDGQKLLIVGGADHKTAHEDSMASFRDLEAHVRKIYDVEEIVYRWSSQFYDPSDSLPYIGHFPQHRENVYVATGFGGNGMTYGTISGMLIRDLILSGESDYQDLFNPNRVKPMAGLSTFVKENVDVAAKFVSGWISQEKIQGLSDLAKGEGKVVSYEGKSIGIYKDEKGSVHAVNPACPHVKCVVDWNRAEKSWDCPCHGSRFSSDGELITGPARKDLDQVHLREESGSAQA